MRDPFSWSFPFGRLFGVAIRVHLWFPLVALGLVLRVAFEPEPEPPAPPLLPNLWVDASILLGLLFLAVLLHEFGHCFGARLVEGDAHEVMLWPLGGLASVEVPHTPYCHFVAAAAGPLVNLALCGVCAMVLGYHSLLPPLNPWSNQLAPRYYNWAEGKYHFDPKYQQGPQRLKMILDRDAGKPAAEPARTTAPEKTTGTSIAAADPAVEVAWLGWADLLAGRFFYVNWLLLLFNLLPGFPLDGGRIFHCLLWSRGDYRQAMQSAIVAGFLVMAGVVIVAVVMNDIMLLILAWVMWSACKLQWYVLEAGGEEAVFGYDFSQGYSSLEHGDEPALPRPKQPNFVQRWLQRRAARKAQAEQERREAEERRLDELLEKVAQNGIQALTDEERRFLTRVSSRYRNRSSGQ